MVFRKKFYLPFVIILLSEYAAAQTKVAQSDRHISIAAGKEYQKSKFGQWIWGKNRRKEWSTKITVPHVLLDTAYGGLTPFQRSGSGERCNLIFKGRIFFECHGICSRSIV